MRQFVEDEAQIMTESNDGFVIAEADLKLRERKPVRLEPDQLKYTDTCGEHRLTL